MHRVTARPDRQIERLLAPGPRVERGADGGQAGFERFAGAAQADTEVCWRLEEMTGHDGRKLLAA